MKLRFSPWSAAIGLLLILMVISILRLVPVSPMDVFWIVVTVACVWAIVRIFFPGKKQ